MENEVQVPHRNTIQPALINNGEENNKLGLQA
jgi:hypothetical protein